MSDQYSMWPETISEAMSSATSSPASAAGPTPSALPAGPTTVPSGPAPVPVSRFRARDSGKAMLTSDTSGPLFTTSSPSARLQSSLESRLRARMDVNGSPEYALTWKVWDMLSGPPICALRASARRTSDSGFGGSQAGWPTPTALDRVRDEETMAKCAAFRKRNANQKTVPLYLGEVAQMAGWPTPVGKDASSHGSSHAKTATHHPGTTLTEAARMTGSGSPAQTEKRGALNPAFSLWLQGYPPEWMASAPSAASVRSAGRGIPSSRKSPQNLSKPSKKVENSS